MAPALAAALLAALLLATTTVLGGVGSEVTVTEIQNTSPENLWVNVSTLDPLGGVLGFAEFPAPKGTSPGGPIACDVGMTKLRAQWFLPSRDVWGDVATVSSTCDGSTWLVRLVPHPLVTIKTVLEPA